MWLAIYSGVCDLRCFGDKTPLDEPLVLSARVSHQNNAKPHRHYFDCDSLHESTTNQTKICNISSLRVDLQNLRGNPLYNKLRFCDSQNLGKKNCAKHPKQSFCFFLPKKSPLTYKVKISPNKVISQNLQGGWLQC